jgi:hypothetical protein
MEETMSEYRIVNHDADQIIVYEDGRFLATVKTHDTAKRIVAALAASPRPQEPAPKEDVNCTRCGDPISDGYMIGDGNGSGQRFAHPECYRQYPGAYKLREPRP